MVSFTAGSVAVDDATIETNDDGKIQVKSVLSHIKFYADNDGGSHDTNTTETTLASVSIPQDDLGSVNKVEISADLGYKIYDSGSSNTFRLYVGGVLKETRIINYVGSYSANTQLSNFIQMYSDVDTTSGATEVKITGQLTHVNVGYSLVACKNLLVKGYL